MNTTKKQFLMIFIKKNFSTTECFFNHEAHEKPFCAYGTNFYGIIQSTNILPLMGQEKLTTRKNKKC